MLKKLTVNKKSKSQALVEFAIILTLLLTLVYGILETGRLMLMYGSTVTAAREATRYGSATGNNSSGIPYYKDCTGIRAAAKNIGFVADFTDANIVISYDHGPNTADFITCDSLVALDGASTDSCLTGTLRTGDRVKTCVSTIWNPIVGGLVPLSWNKSEKNCSGATVTRANYIQKSSERTILCGVSIGVTPVATWVGSGGLSLTCGSSTSPAPYDHVGQVITYTYFMTNTGSSDLTGAFTIAADRGPATCGAGYTIYPGRSYTCTGYYTITQADLDAVSVVNTATAYTSGASSVPCSNTVLSSQAKQLTLTISATDSANNAITTALLGTVVKFTYKLTNTGNVTLTSPSYTLTDTVPPPSASAVTCPTVATLPPGGAITCTENYTIQASDVTASKLVNTATLAYTPPSAATQTTTAAATVYTSPLILTVTTSVSPLTEGQVPPSATKAGQVITYNYVIYNNSGFATTAVAPTINITGASFTPFTVTCPAVSIPNNGYMTCTATYTVTQPNIDAGAVKPLIHTATAAANNGSAITSGAMPVSVPIVTDDELTLAISATTTPSTLPPTVTAVGNTFVFNYTLTNTGNTTLISPFTITAPLPPGTTNPSTIRGGATSLTVTCSSTSDLLPASVTVPAQSTTCSSAPITVIANDLNNYYGSYYITNPAVANAMTKVVTGGRASIKVSSAPQTGLIATAGARLNVVIKDTLIGSRQIQYTYTLVNTGNSEITIPSAYSIPYTITGNYGGVSITPITGTFVCAAPITIAINSSVQCLGGSAYDITTLTSGSITNTVTPLPPLTNPTLSVTGMAVTTTLTSLCNVTHSGTIPDATVADINGVYKTTWNIKNSISPSTIVKINSIILTWATLDTEITNVSLTGVSPTLVWSGKTKGSDGFFPISVDTNSATTKPTWPLAFNSGTQTMGLTFTKSTVQIRVKLGFSDPVNCSAEVGLDSGDPTQTTASLSIVKTATPATYTAAGNVISYSFLVTNDGGRNLAGPVTVADDKATNETCPALTTVGNLDNVFDPGESITCTASYTILAADVTAGSVTNVASASAGGVTSPTATKTVTRSSSSLSIVKTATPATYTAAGNVISYSFLVTNNGSTNLAGPVTVADNKATNETCPSLTTVGNSDNVFNPGESITCTASYTILAADVTAGSVTNVASATAGGTTSPTATETVTRSSLSIVKTATPATYTAAGNVISYSFLVTNNGGTSLAGPVTVADNKATNETCPALTTIGNLDNVFNPGESITCTASYTILAADVTAGSVTNVASATAGGVTSPTDTETVTRASLSIVKTATPATYTAAGNVISYSFLVTNNGGTSLAGPVTVADDKATNETCPALTTVGDLDNVFDPAESITCTASYTILAADVTAGSVTNVASATAGGVTSPTDTETVTLLACTLPVAPSAPTATLAANKKSVSVSWTPISGTTSNLYVSIDGGAYNSLQVNATSPFNHTISTGTYSYKVSAVNACGEGPQSAASSTITVRSVSGAIGKEAIVTNITLSTTIPTITVGGVACDRTTVATVERYTCLLTNGTGAIRVASYSTGNTSSGKNNKVCTTPASPAGTVTSNGTSGEYVTYSFSSLTSNQTFNLYIIKETETCP